MMSEEAAENCIKLYHRDTLCSKNARKEDEIKNLIGRRLGKH